MGRVKIGVRKALKVPLTDAPASLTLALGAPGMSPLHRAGLGGLACSLRYIEEAAERNDLKPKDLPGGPWGAGKPPWEITPTQVALHFGDPAKAAEFLRRLFALSFGCGKDGLIRLPGQYGSSGEPPAAVRAELQSGLLSTFLQHGKSRKLGATPKTVEHEPDGLGLPPTIIEYRACEKYDHQGGYSEMADAKGIARKMLRIAGPVSPGAVVRHVAFNADTAVAEPAQRVLPLYFALVGCLAFAGRDERGAPVGILVIPEVHDLTRFVSNRPFMTPRTEQDCRIAGASDAVLQALVRLKVKAKLNIAEIGGAHAMTFRSTPWASQQKSRVATIHIPAADEEALRRFEIAWQLLPARKVARPDKETSGRGRPKVVTERKESFWAESTVRPLVAENLAAGRPWYEGFTRLMVLLDGNNRPLRDKLGYEKKGLHQMTQRADMFTHPGERAVVQAVHEALRSRYGQIADENKGSPVIMKKRWASEYDRWRLAFAGAKTAAQLRTALMDLFSRGGGNRILKDSWEAVLPLLGEKHWQLTRDLALLALPSYAGAGNKGEDDEKHN